MHLASSVALIVRITGGIEQAAKQMLLFILFYIVGKHKSFKLALSLFLSMFLSICSQGSEWTEEIKPGKHRQTELLLNIVAPNVFELNNINYLKHFCSLK